MIEQALGIVLALSIVSYLISFARLLKAIQEKSPAYWSDLGSPSMFDANDQVLIIKKILVAKGMPKDVYLLHRASIVRVRVLLSVFLICFPLAVIG